MNVQKKNILDYENKNINVKTQLNVNKSYKTLHYMVAHVKFM